ncbi:MAG: adenylyl-sulfate kinase [Terriglobales bacterium]
MSHAGRTTGGGGYRAAQAGAIADLTGVGQPYEPPQAPAWTADTTRQTPEDTVTGLLGLLRDRGFLHPPE